MNLADVLAAQALPLGAIEDSGIALLDASLPGLLLVRQTDGTTIRIPTTSDRDTAFYFRIVLGALGVSWV